MYLPPVLEITRVGAGGENGGEGSGAGLLHLPQHGERLCVPAVLEAARDQGVVGHAVLAALQPSEHSYCLVYEAAVGVEIHEGGTEDG